MEVGGYFSIKRNVMSIPLDVHISPEEVVPFCKAVLEVFRDHGGREDRQKARLMWLVEAATIDGFRDLVAKQMGLPGGEALRHEVSTSDGGFEVQACCLALCSLWSMLLQFCCYGASQCAPYMCTP